MDIREVVVIISSCEKEDFEILNHHYRTLLRDSSDQSLRDRLKILRTYTKRKIRFWKKSQPKSIVQEFDA